MGSLSFFYPAISRFSVAAISFVIACNLKTAQIASTNQLFQLLNLICSYGDPFYGLTRMLMSNLDRSTTMGNYPPQYPSPKATLTRTSHLKKNFGLQEG